MNPELVVIVGPTASGKSALAIDIAKKFNGEIICADSRTVYRGMDIGTGKPTKADQHVVPHWGLDLVEPNERFSAADFKKYADEKILEIKERGHIPILVGGTGLYIDAVIFDYQFGKPIDNIMRSELQQMSLQQLHEYCAIKQINLPENYKNKRYVVRAIENCGIEKRQDRKPIYNITIVGITTDKILLHLHIEHRIEKFLEYGVIDEAKNMAEKYGWEIESMKSNIYPLIHSYLKNEISIDELKEKAIIADWHLAKRQLTWLRHNTFIHWENLDQANTYLSNQLVTTK